MCVVSIIYGNTSLPASRLIFWIRKSGGTDLMTIDLKPHKIYVIHELSHIPTPWTDLWLDTT